MFPIKKEKKALHTAILPFILDKLIKSHRMKTKVKDLLKEKGKELLQRMTSGMEEIIAGFQDTPGP